MTTGTNLIICLTGRFHEIPDFGYQTFTFFVQQEKRTSLGTSQLACFAHDFLEQHFNVI
jgi:hypothetical protein